MSEPIASVEPGGVAIVGIAGRFPSASSPAALWQLLREGREATQWLTDDELRQAGVAESELADPNYVRASLVLPDMEMFDSEFFGFSKRDADVLDPQHRHFLESAWEALEDAGHMPENFAGAVGVFGGCGMQAYLAYNLLSNPGLVRSMGLFLLRHTGNDKDFLCSRVSYLLNLKGPSVTVQTACSTSLVAVHMAAQSLLAGECDMALAGGASIELPHRRGYRYAEGEILSPDGHCRAFDDSAAGTIFGSGAAVVVLRRLEDALQGGDNIYAVIRGSAVNNDGSQKAGYLAPSVDGQARAAAEALAVAGVPPRTVQYIEAHGTGTAVGDPIELAALTQAYGDGGTAFCGIGSIKTNIGHLDTAAGAAALIKVVLAMRHGLIPASLNFTRPNSRLDMAATPFEVVARPRPWPRSQTPRRAAVNSLGVGGTNAHVILEEPPLQADALLPQAAAPQLFTFSARTPQSLERLKAKWVQFLADAPPGFKVADAAFTLQTGRRAFEHRCAVAARDTQELHAALQASNHPRSVTSRTSPRPPAVVFMFPGGGAHYPGAGRELMSRPAFADAVHECFRLMPADAPADLRAAMFERAASDAEAARTLQRPTYAIPALFVLEYAIAQLWDSWGVRPSALIGHSAGEYAAACLAGVLPLADALTVVVLRGQLFEQVPAGAMMAVDLPEGELRALIADLELDVAAINAPDLCIASGTLEAIGALEGKLASRGLEGRRLHIDVAAHSRLLDGVLGRFRERLSRVRFAAPTIPFVSNLTGRWADAALLCNPDYWVRHLREPVRFADGLALLGELPDAVLVETGPGQGLCALARQNQRGAQRMVLACTGKAQEANADLALMLTSAGALWTRGLQPSWEAIRGPGPRRRVSLPTYAFDHRRHWIEPGTPAAQDAPVPAPGKAASGRAIERLARMDDWFRVPHWIRTPLPASQPSAGGRWLVFGNRSPLTAEVAAQAGALGARVVVVRAGDEFVQLRDGSFTVVAGEGPHYERLLRALDEQGALPERVVHLWALDSPAGTAERQLRAQELAFDSLVHFARAVQALDLTQPMHLTVVTAGTFGVLGEPVAHPERALALGPCRVVPREVPNISTRLVDLAQEDVSSADAARAICIEALNPSGVDLAAYRAGERYTQHFDRAGELPTPKRPFVREGGAYLITGGLGDIALELASYLAKSRKARLALVSRRDFPPKARWPALAASAEDSDTARRVRRLLSIEQDGGAVIVLSGDAADRRAMTRAIEECRARLGALNGVFHAAGALDDAPIATKTAESIARVLRSKAQGAQILSELLPAGQLDVFAVFSSTSVLLGVPGQVDYVAANAFLDSLAASREDGLVIRWGIWGDRGMAARAYGGGIQALAGASHPLLGAQVDSEDGAAFEAVYDSTSLWVLREHQVGGRPVLPGTAYIELARAAMMALHPHAAIEIRSLSFEEAMVFEPGTTRRVRTEMRHNATGYDLRVCSRGAQEQQWLEHARAAVSLFVGGLPAQDRFNAQDWQGGRLPQEHGVDFGPRWRNIKRLRLGRNEAVAELELAGDFQADLSCFGAHPALTDMAATFGLLLLEQAQREDHLFVPLSVDRIRLVAPVPQRLVSRVQLKGAPAQRMSSFDVILSAPDGSPVANFEGFSLRAVRPEAVAQHAPRPREANLAEMMLACGIRGEDAHAIFERILCGGARDLVVSSIDVEPARRVITQHAAPRSAAPKPHEAAEVTAVELNPVESALAEAWRELLGVDEVAPQDDFFALGGHSLAAVRLFARIRKQYGVDLPLAKLFEAPTLGALAELVARTAGMPAPSSAEPVEKPNVIPLGTRAWSPLVTICRGSPQRTPLFCVHGAGGNVLNFKVISDRLGTEQPFYGLQAQGVDGRMPLLGSIEEMAGQYVEAVRTVDPQGPYQLAGYSGGGVIALAMAQQLKREGAQVTLLAMIDTLSPAAARRRVSYLKKLWLMRHWTLDFALEWPGRRRKGKQADAAYAQALERLARGEPLPPELLEFHLFRSFVAAQALYEPPPYAGDIVLFKAKLADTQYLGAGAALGWEEHVTGAIRLVEVPGSHFTMMSEPGVSQLIEGLRRELWPTSAPPNAPRGAVGNPEGAPATA